MFECSGHVRRTSRRRTPRWRVQSGILFRDWGSAIRTLKTARHDESAYVESAADRSDIKADDIEMGLHTQRREEPSVQKQPCTSRHLHGKAKVHGY